MGLKSGKSIKPSKARKGYDPDFLAQIAARPCIICKTFNMPQLSPTTVHHVCHDRFSQQKTPDRMAIPLCDGHHQGRFDTSKVAIHREKERWRELYGPDHSYSDGSSH